MSKSANQIISEYIRLLTTGHVKGIGRDFTKEETELCVSLLQAVAADIEFATPPDEKTKLLTSVLDILTHATCERPEGKSWLLGPGEVEAAVLALGEQKP